jgi:hypothetical protein
METCPIFHGTQELGIKKKHHSSDSPLEGTISTRALLI